MYQKPFTIDHQMELNPSLPFAKGDGGDDLAVDDVAVADDDGAGFHDQHQNDAESAEVAPL